MHPQAAVALKRLAGMLILLLASATALPAQEISEPQIREPEIREPREERRPPWYKSKVFWASTAVAVAAAVADAESTQGALNRCSTCFESNPAFGSRRPGRGRLYLIGGISLAAERALVIGLWERQPQAANAVMFGATTLRAVYHGTFAYQNSQIARSCPANGAGCAP